MQSAIANLAGLPAMTEGHTSVKILMNDQPRWTGHTARPPLADSVEAKRYVVTPRLISLRVLSLASDGFLVRPGILAAAVIGVLLVESFANLLQVAVDGLQLRGIGAATSEKALDGAFSARVDRLSISQIDGFVDYFLGVGVARPDEWAQVNVFFAGPGVSK